MAPTQPEMQSLMPILSSKIIARRVSTRITRDNVFFHWGTWEKSTALS